MAIFAYLAGVASVILYNRYLKARVTGWIESKINNLGP